MNALLEKAFAQAAKLSEPEQQMLATQLLQELADEERFDRTLANSSESLADMARAALQEHQLGQTEPLDPSML